MTKRLLAAVALVSALATAAEATQGRVAVVYPSNISGTGSGLVNIHTQVARNNRMVFDVLDRGGVQYFVIPGKLAKVEQLRLGVIGLGSQVDTVVGVIHLSFHGNASSNGQAGYRGDSLLRISRGGCNVPQLFLSDNWAPLGSLATNAHLSDAVGAAAARCSTGVTGTKTNPLQGQGLFWHGNTDLRYINSAYNSGWVVNPTPPGGGFRSILGGSASGWSIKLFDASTINRNCTWPDSMPFIANSDTVMVWERPWNIASQPDAKPLVFCDWFGAGAVPDSTDGGLSYYPNCEGNLATLLVGLARFDSLCGGIFRRPIQGAITVQSALSRGPQRWNHGIAPGDTAVFYGSLDSLKAWGVPVTFYANVDSSDAYARDIIKLKEVTSARFSIQVWDGVANAAKGNTLVLPSSTNNGLPRDIFGYGTARAIYGDGTAAGDDSSMWALLKSAKMRRDSIFGIARISRSLRAPLDDFSPLNKTAAGSIDWADSLAWMLAESDIRALIVNGRSLDLNRDYGLPRAFARQQTYRPMIGRKPLNILAHNGGMLCGGQFQQVALSDSATFPGRHTNVEREINRALAGCLLNSWEDFDQLPYEDTSGGGELHAYRGVRFETEDLLRAQFPKRGSIVQVSCADLSGSESGPARSGLWVIKSLWDTSRIVNALAGRPIFQLTYPENVRP